MLGENQGDRPPFRRVAGERARIVLGNTFFEAITRRADVIAAVGAPQNIQICPLRHGPPSILRDALLRNAPQDEGGTVTERSRKKEYRHTHRPHPEEPAEGRRLEGWREAQLQAMRSCVTSPACRSFRSPASTTPAPRGYRRSAQPGSSDWCSSRCPETSASTPGRSARRAGRR